MALQGGLPGQSAGGANPALNARASAMMQGLQQQGGGPQNPAQGPPTAQQPGGFPPQNDIFDRHFQALRDGARMLGGLLRKAGDARRAVALEKCGLEIEKERMQRANDLAKINEAKQQLVNVQSAG